MINSENPPLGLALLSSIWDHQGHTSQIIDAAVLGLDTRDILSRIHPATDFVGITATTPEITSAVAIARAVRERFPGISIVMGGAHPTVFHREMVSDNICDMVVRNEGEIPVMELARGTPYPLIPNLTWRNSGNETVINSGLSTPTDLDALPFPAYQKLPMHLYHSALGAARKSPSIGMVTSRGCPGKCTFCFSDMFGSRIQFMSPARIIEHIEHLQKNYGIKEISFYDDTFTTRTNNVIELCSIMMEREIKISWSCFARVDTVTPDLLLFMKKAGCHQIMYGFESADENILNAINKQINLQQIRKAIDWTRASGMNIRGAFMLGNPGETPESMQKTIAFAVSAGIQFAIFNITTPYPGTAMYKEYCSKNALLHQNWDLYNLAQPVIKLDTISDKDVMQSYYRSYRDFYLRPLFILRHVVAIRTLSELMMYGKAALKVIGLLLRSIVSGKSS